MKNFRIKYVSFAIASILTLGSCSDEFLTLQKQGSTLEEDYYKTEDQAYAALVAAYSAIRQNSGNFENNITWLNAGSDDHFSGGGDSADGKGLQSFSNYTVDQNTMPGSYWSVPYQGIFSANKLLEKIEPIPMDASKKERFIAESKALRAYYYFHLVTFFKNVPLLLKPLTTAEIKTVTQAKPEEVYAQIEKDLKDAIAVLPVTVTSDELGRLTKGAVTALLGKVLLYEKKYPEAATQLALVNGTPGGTSAYGYKLVANFVDLWKVSNKFNTESILEVVHTDLSAAGWDNWGSSKAQGNIVNIMTGPRGYTPVPGKGAPNLSQGWSFNPITDELYALLKMDKRFNATVLDMKELEATGKIDKYIRGYKDTGYLLNKFMPKVADERTGAGERELNYKQDTYAIRLADTYLLEAEALGGTGARAQALLDAVRKRAGEAVVPVSMDAIMKERRLELAGEGHRWMDLVRTGKATTALGSRGFVAGKNEIFPIPLSELLNTKLVQNPNY
jgi:starch-binding outer membrane protein, SusD/RagB family